MNLTGIGGIWPATLTPFTADGAIDAAALKAHVAHVGNTRGVRALVVNGHAGEASALDRDERAQVIRQARETAPASVGIVAGIIADDTRGACQLARDAEAAGADALLLFPLPVFGGGAQQRPEMVMRYVQAVAAASSLPLVIFQFPRSGLGYSTATLVQMCRDVPMIIAIKEGSDSPVAYEENLRALRALPRPVTILNTNNSWLLQSLALGGDGILSGMGSCAASLQADLFDAMAAGDLAAARRANDRIFPLTQAFYRAPYCDAHSRMKTALTLMGLLPGATVREPLLPLPAEDVARIKAALTETGLLAPMAAQ